jgi:hypothetical protein
MQKNQQLKALTDAVLKVVFPCYVPQSEEGTVSGGPAAANY